MIWKSRHWHLGISIGIDVGIGIDIEKNLFCLAKSLFLEIFGKTNKGNICGGVSFPIWVDWTIRIFKNERY